MRKLIVLFCLLCSLLPFQSEKNRNITLGLDESLLLKDWAVETPKVGHISKLRLERVDMTNFNDIVYYCNTNFTQNSYPFFKQCSGKLKDIKIFVSNRQDDMRSWTMRSNLPFFDRETKINQPKHDTFRFIVERRGGIPEPSKPYAPHLVAIAGAFVSKWGYIFDTQKLYNHGGCANKGWDEPNLEIDLWKFKVLTFNEPILSLVHPYSRAYFHEMIETYSTLFVVKPLLDLLPNLPILVKMNSRWLLKNDFSTRLLTALDINPESLNIVPLGPQDVNFVTKFLIRNFFKDNNAVARAPYVIAPLSLYCQFISRGTLMDMRKKLALSLPHLWYPVAPGWSGQEVRRKEEVKLILLYHNAEHWRLKFEEARTDSKARLEGAGGGRRRRRKQSKAAASAPPSVGNSALFHSLAARYHAANVGDGVSAGSTTEEEQGQWRVREFRGNESFDDTVRLFRAARFFIATHGGGMSNILFMQEGSSVVELRPVEWPNSCYVDICNALDVNYYDIRTSNGDDVMDAAGSSTVFLDRLFRLIDDYKE